MFLTLHGSSNGWYLVFGLRYFALQYPGLLCGALHGHLCFADWAHFHKRHGWFFVFLTVHGSSNEWHFALQYPGLLCGALPGHSYFADWALFLKREGWFLMFLTLHGSSRWW